MGGGAAPSVERLQRGVNGRDAQGAQAARLPAGGVVATRALKRQVPVIGTGL